MSRSARIAGRFAALFALVLLMPFSSGSGAGDATKGAQVFKRCIACHQVGPNARNTTGPHLNEVFGRKAGSLEGFKGYSANMKKAGGDGFVWTDETMSKYLESPRGVISGTRMMFAGLRSPAERADVIAYMRQFSKDAEAVPSGTAAAPAGGAGKPAAAVSGVQPKTTSTAFRRDPNAPRHGRFNLGREATKAEIAAWDIDVRPDGQGLPKGKGTVKQGEQIYIDRCASCHGDFGEAVGRWPALAGGKGSLNTDRPEKTIGSYWPYLSTVWDYVNRAMPFGDAQSLTNDEVYAVVAYLLFLNDIVTDEKFELSNSNFTKIRLPNESNFIDDDRGTEPIAKPHEPCMKNCIPGQAGVTMRARVLDVTPTGADKDTSRGRGAIE